MHVAHHNYRGRPVMNDPKHDLILYGAWLSLIGALIALGKLLAGSEPLSVRLCIGRTILGSATSLIAGMLLIQIPDIPPLALIATGSALGIAGAQVVEAMMIRWGTRKQ